MFDLAPILAMLPKVSMPFGLNFFDVIILIVILFYAYEGYILGFVLASLDLASFILSFIIALKFYPFIARILIDVFSIPIGFANAIGFLLLAFLSEVVLSILFRRLFKRIPSLKQDHPVYKFFKQFDHFLGLIPGMISAFIILSFFLSLIVSLPTSPVIKTLAADSKIGSQLIANTSFFESKLNDVFGGALHESLNFLTVKPQSEESVSLHFKTNEGTVDEAAEQEMFELVNKERKEAGLRPVVFDNALRDVGRAHSLDMFVRGYFSHFTPDGLSPFDRMDKVGISYVYAGENLALAPSTSLAMQGLMNSPGHRANILNPNFGKVGIGVIDGGIYGKMYSQEFTD
jgi:uncharacterized protein YkwD